MRVGASYDRIGDVLVAQGDGPGALAAYLRCLAIADALAARDPANTQWQRNLSVSQIKIGDMLVAQRDGTGALAAYRRSLDFAEVLAARDAANTDWQRNLSVSHDRIGDVLVAQGNGLGALAAYRQGLAIREALAPHDPPNTQWQTDVAVSCAKLGMLDHGQNREARQRYLLRGREILVKLKSAGRLMANQDGIAWFDEQLVTLETVDNSKEEHVAEA